jgi:hypothetical protein
MLHPLFLDHDLRIAAVDARLSDPVHNFAAEVCEQKQSDNSENRVVMKKVPHSHEKSLSFVDLEKKDSPASPPALVVCLGSRCHGSPGCLERSDKQCLT